MADAPVVPALLLVVAALGACGLLLPGTPGSLVVRVDWARSGQPAARGRAAGRRLRRGAAGNEAFGARGTDILVLVVDLLDAG